MNVWRHNGDVNPGRNGSTRKLERLFQRLGAVIDAWQEMTMQVDHERAMPAAAGPLRAFAGFA
jgi:hypothetical protein